MRECLFLALHTRYITCTHRNEGQVILTQRCLELVAVVKSSACVCSNACDGQARGCFVRNGYYHTVLLRTSTSCTSAVSGRSVLACFRQVDHCKCEISLLVVLSRGCCFPSGKTKQTLLRRSHNNQTGSVKADFVVQECESRAPKARP